ncbi:DUF7500 family protein [Halobacteriaceae archaeon SHR40]|uniref:DUF7500 family protein n=1 Tax=Halovenus amylolytica TaxID=2500550 RepID=UPI000FE39B9B
MVDGPSDESGDGGTADEGKILSPHELDISDSEYVEEIDEGRYVVSPDSRGPDSSAGRSQGGGQGSNQAAGGGSQPQQGGQPNHPPQDSGQSQSNRRLSGNSGQPTPTGDHSNQRGHGQAQSGHGGQLTEEAVRRWLREKYQQNSSKYAFDVTAQFDGTVSQRTMASNDLITVFESLMLWYAQQVDSGMPVEEVLGILLMESNVPVRYPPESVKNLIRSTDLGPEDSIADLLDAVQDRDGVQL